MVGWQTCIKPLASLKMVSWQTPIQPLTSLEVLRLTNTQKASRPIKPLASLEIKGGPRFIKSLALLEVVDLPRSLQPLASLKLVGWSRPKFLCVHFEIWPELIDPKCLIWTQRFRPLRADLKIFSHRKVLTGYFRNAHITWAIFGPLSYIRV